jgi:hypothetical protein
MGRRPNGPGAALIPNMNQSRSLLRFKICELPDIGTFGAIKTGVTLPSLNKNLTQTHPDPCLFQSMTIIQIMFRPNLTCLFFSN